MAVYTLSAERAGAPLPRLAASVCVALLAGHIVFLVGSLIDGSWYLTFIDVRKPCNA